MIYRNKKYSGLLATNPWRRMAMASWAAPKDPTIYGVMEINVENALKFIAEQAAASNERITITHFVGKAFGEIFKAYPDMNTQIRWGRFYQRADISIAFQVAIDEAHNPDDLSNAVVHNIDQKKLPEIARELSEAASRARKHHDPDFKRVKGIANFVPGFLLRPAVRILEFITNTLNIWSPALGLPRSAFGSMLLTNVGSLGLDMAFAAIFPPAGCPAIFSMGRIYQAAVYNADGSFRLAPHIRICGSVDHRYMDGLQVSKGARILRDVFASPQKFF
jgi:pyruvate/2-oxoglutarate dehydrogenase complex dihydrolipoamide acyltransferase (E2) component